jgi:hypothetical protein
MASRGNVYGNAKVSTKPSSRGLYSGGKRCQKNVGQKNKNSPLRRKWGDGMFYISAPEFF